MLGGLDLCAFVVMGLFRGGGMCGLWAVLAIVLMFLINWWFGLVG